MEQYFLWQIFPILQKKEKAQVTLSTRFFEKYFFKSQISMKQATKLQKNWQISRSLPRKSQDLDSRS
jgi:hypothetical protein